MSKKLWFKLLLIGSLVAAGVMWLVSVIMLNQLAEGVDPNWFVSNIGLLAALVVTGSWGLAFTLMGLFSKNSIGMFKKLQVIFGVALLAVAVVVSLPLFITGWVMATNMWLPIVAVAVAVALLLSLLAVGGRKWDQADNENKNSQPAYKKTEWEKRKEQQERDNKNN